MIMDNSNHCKDVSPLCLHVRQHSQRVALLALEIGKAIKLYQEELSILNLAAHLHDIGKLYISEKILLKKEPLTESEMEVIKTHPVIGEIQAGNMFCVRVNDAIRHHHERIDGKGYPDGLTGSKISVITKVITIADAYDAMTSARQYKKTLSAREAVEELIKNAGTQFEPTICDAFIKLLYSKLVLNKYSK